MTIQLDANEQVLIALIDETQKNLARIVRTNRVVLDLTQSDLGARAGVHQTRICGLEKRGTASTDLLIRAAHGLGVSASTLLKAAEDQKTIIESCAFAGEARLRLR